MAAETLATIGRAKMLERLREDLADCIVTRDVISALEELTDGKRHELYTCEGRVRRVLERLGISSGDGPFWHEAALHALDATSASEEPQL